jgi:hypothetical protein
MKAPAFAYDPENLLWVPRRKLISIPPPAALRVTVYEPPARRPVGYVVTPAPSGRYRWTRI